MLHVPGGTCDDVGIAGHMQGGGYGFTTREYGVNCDRVREVRVMLADGRIIRANRERNKHLHWAVRGGTGGNFGVLLDVTYNLADLYDVWGFVLQWPINEAPGVLVALQEGFMRGGDAPSEFGYYPVLATIDGAQVLVVLGMYHGSREDGMDVIAPLQAIGSPTLTMDSVDTYANLNEGLLDVLAGPGPTGTFEAKRSGYISSPLGEDGWTAVCEYYKATPNPFNIAFMEPYGGQVSAIAPDDCAFVHRAVDLNLFVDSFWNPSWPNCHTPDVAWNWVNGFIETFHRRQRVLIRNERTNGQWVHQTKRPSFGLSASPTLYGLFGGFGPFTRIRHFISPTFGYAYAPAAEVSDEFLQALGRTRKSSSSSSTGYLPSLAQNSLSLVSRHTEASSSTNDTNPDEGEKIKLLSLQFTGINYDFERDCDRLTHPGLTTQNFGYTARSDLLPGVDLGVDYSLFEGSPLSDTALQAGIASASRRPSRSATRTIRSPSSRASSVKRCRRVGPARIA